MLSTDVTHTHTGSKVFCEVFFLTWRDALNLMSDKRSKPEAFKTESESGVSGVVGTKKGRWA